MASGPRAGKKGQPAPSSQASRPRADDALRDAAIDEMKRVFGDDRRRIDHALAVLDYAEQILAREDADPLVVKAAAVLHDIGIHKAEEKHGSAAGRLQEIEGPPIARDILGRLNVRADDVDHICLIIANHHSARDIDTPEFRIVWDADWLVNIPDEFPDHSPKRLADLIARVFKTDAGRDIARSTFLPSAPTEPGK